MNQPEKKSDQLLKRLGVMMRLPHVSEFEMAMVEREVRSLMPIDPFGANLALSIIASIKANVQDMRKYHQRARALGIGSDIVVADANYIVTLLNTGLYAEALEYAKSLFEIAPDNLDFLDLYIESAFRSLRLELAKSLVDERARRVPKALSEANSVKEIQASYNFSSMEDDIAMEQMSIPKIQSPDIYKIIELAAEHARRMGLDDDKLFAVYKAIEPIFREGGIRISKCKMAVATYDDEAWLDVIYHTDRSPEKAAELNAEAADRIARKADADAMMFAVVRFTCDPELYANSAA
ncbi:MAG TPA: hypothetical protein ENK05_08720 [Gammaproteobacteria bacterium]|nr:hypothetical protein [Gammaproteobacteria bacterium]